MHLCFIVPPRAESIKTTPSAVNFLTPHPMVESNSHYSTELVEETTKKFSENVIEYVMHLAEDEDVVEEITEYNYVHIIELPLIMDAMFKELPILEISSDYMLPASLIHLYDKHKAYSQKE